MRRLNEYLDGLLPLLAGEAADAVGETVTTRGALRSPDAPTPDVYLAALGPQMLKIAGRRTAGTLHVDDGAQDARPSHVGPTLRAGGRRRGSARGRGPGGGRRCRSASPTTSTARASAGRRAVRDVRRACRPTARCSTARATPAPRTPRSSATRRPSRIDSTNWRRSASTNSPRWSSTALPQVRERTRALLLSKDS